MTLTTNKIGQEQEAAEAARDHDNNPMSEGEAEFPASELGKHGLIWAGVTSQYGFVTPLEDSASFGEYVQWFRDLGYDEEWVGEHIDKVQRWHRQGMPKPGGYYVAPEGYDEAQLNVHAFAYEFPEQITDPQVALGALAFSACHTILQGDLLKTCGGERAARMDQQHLAEEIQHRSDYVRMETAYGRRVRTRLGRIAQEGEGWMVQVADEIIRWQEAAWRSAEEMGLSRPFVYWSAPDGGAGDSDPEKFTYPTKPEDVREPLLALAAVAVHTVAVAVFRRRIAENIVELENTSDTERVNTLTSESLRFSGYSRADAERAGEHRMRLEEVAYDGVSGLGPEIRKAARILDSWLYELTPQNG